LALAGLKKYVGENSLRDENLVAIDSGANINFDRLRYISERTEIGEKREAVIAVTIPEKPGSFKAFCHAIGKRNITEFNYRYADQQKAHIFVGVQVAAGDKDRTALVRELDSKGYLALDMTDNEIAKLHIRHLVGGRAPTVSDERVFRFEFPERPGALMHFLNGLGQRWNISLFHYRNHGAAEGRVLAGLQVPVEEYAQLERYLDELNYPWVEETANPAYQLFLS
jgi:threonine dehydratase